jgi:serine/threonine protein kinase
MASMKVGPGTVIAGRFVLRSVAAAGGMGSVFLANERDTARNVAIKILSREGPEDLVRFGREASLLATIHHPNIVKYIAHGESEGVYYIAQEWVEGMTLALQLRTVGVTASEAIALAIGVAEALGAAHAIGVVHRDVKPSNIILDGNSLQQPRLVDFGVARMTDEAGVLTRTGVLVGTPAYMSPEQCKATTQIDAAADVWALGCVLYEALTGRTPFAGATATATRAKVLLGTPPLLKQFCAEANEQLSTLVNEMLAKDPGRRPTNGTMVTERLRALPPINDGPRRKTFRTSSTQAATAGQAGLPDPADLMKTPRIGPAEALAQANSYVFVTPQSPPSAVDSPPSAVDDAQKLAAIAARMGMQLVVLEDGTAMLSSNDRGKAGAVAAARVAIEIREQVWEDAAVTVFGRAYDDHATDAFDRGATMLEKSQMESMFGGVVDDVTPVIHVDDVIAELVSDEIPIEHGAYGPAIRTKPR